MSSSQRDVYATEIANFSSAVSNPELCYDWLNDQYNVGTSIVQRYNGKETESLNSDDIPKKRV